MSSMGKRDPAVAGLFYPGDPGALVAQVDRFVGDDTTSMDAKAVIMPHAGYIYSGATAGSVAGSVRVPGRVIMLGPKHRRSGARAAVATVDAWSFPFSDVPVDHEIAQMLVDRTEIEEDDLAHRDEHSLEVQVPFLWRRNPDLVITPVALGLHSVEELEKIGEGVASVIEAIGEPVLLVASTDMSHQIPLDEARRLDHLAIDRILAIDPEGLYDTVFDERISMCGVIPVTAALFAARTLGARSADLLSYTTSADASGDTSSVVGYAGIAII